MHKIRTQDGKWKTMVKRTNKKMVAAALAGTLMGSTGLSEVRSFYAELAKEVNLVNTVEASSVDTANQANFIKIAQRLPNVSEIKKRYAKLSGAYHPDNSYGNEKIMKEINLQYNKRMKSFER